VSYPPDGALRQDGTKLHSATQKLEDEGKYFPLVPWPEIFIDSKSLHFVLGTGNGLCGLALGKMASAVQSSGLQVPNVPGVLGAPAVTQQAHRRPLNLT